MCFGGRVVAPWTPTGLPGSPAGLPDRRCGGEAEGVKSEHVAYLAETWITGNMQSAVKVVVFVYVTDVLMQFFSVMWGGGTSTL